MKDSEHWQNAEKCLNNAFNIVGEAHKIIPDQLKQRFQIMNKKTIEKIISKISTQEEIYNLVIDGFYWSKDRIFGDIWDDVDHEYKLQLEKENVC